MAVQSVSSFPIRISIATYSCTAGYVEDMHTLVQMFVKPLAKENTGDDKTRGTRRKKLLTEVEARRLFRLVLIDRPDPPSTVAPDVSSCCVCEHCACLRGKSAETSRLLYALTRPCFT